MQAVQHRLGTTAYLLCVFSLCRPTLADVTAALVNSQLDQPTGVAVQPGTGAIYVAESGQGRIVRVDAENIISVIEGFANDADPDEPFAKTGPLGLCFLGRQTLLVGTGGNSIGEDTVLVFQLDTESEGVLKATDGMSLGTFAATLEHPALGDFWSMAASPGAVWSTTRGDRKQHWLVRAEIKDPKQLDQASSFGPFTRTIATGTLTEGTEAQALAISPMGEIVASQRGNWGGERDSRLSFFRSTDGKRLMDLATDRFDLVSLAYGAPQGPANVRQLYALDFAADNADEAGLYRLDSTIVSGRVGLRGNRLVSLQHPISMCFHEDGSLWIVGGPTKSDASNPPRGNLWRIDSGL